MAWDDPVVWVLIVGAIILLFGSNKIPELARSLGAAKKEFDQARKGFMGAINTEINNAGNAAPSAITPPARPPGLTNPPRAVPSVDSTAAPAAAIPSPSSAVAQPKGEAERQIAGSDDDPLLIAARSEGIDTRGKTRSQIASELASKVKD